MKPVQRDQPPRPWGAFALAALVLVYLASFYCSSKARWEPLVLALLPDDLIRQWVGGDWSRFGLFDRGPLLLTVAGILLTAYCAGRLLLGPMGVVGGLTRLEIVVFAVAAGMNLLSLWTLAVGLAGGLHQPWAFLAPALAVIAACAIGAARRIPGGRGTAALHSGKPQARGRPGKGEATSPFARARLSRWLWAAAPFAVLIVLGGVVPPWEFDVCEYHLEVPKEWFRAGRVEFMPHNVYGNMPLGAEMHALAAMAALAITGSDDAWWPGAIAGKTIIACFAPLTALALAAAGRRWFSATAGGIAAAVYLATPWIVHVSTAGLIDGVVAFYLFTSVYAVLLWAGIDAPNGNRSRSETVGAGATRPVGLLFLAGFLAGAAAACKYPGIVFVVLPLAGYVLLEGVVGRFARRGPESAAGSAAATKKKAPVARADRRPSLHLRAVALFLLAAGVGCGLWFVKNWALAGNPTYPLLSHVFGGRQLTRGDDWQRAHQVPKDTAGRAYTPAQLGKSIAQVVWTSDWIQPLIVPLAGAALVVARRRRPVLLMGAVALWVLAVWWLLTHRIDRFWLPALPPLALLAGLGATLRNDKPWRMVVGWMIALSLAACLVIAASRAIGDNRFLVAQDDLRRDEPNAADPMDVRVHVAHRYMNQHTRPGDRVLLVGDAQPFELEPPAIYATCFDECPLERLMKGRTRQERLDALRRERIAYVFVYWREIKRYRDTYGFTDYVTKDIVRTELAEQQQLLRKVPLLVMAESGEQQPLPADSAELFEVIGK